MKLRNRATELPNDSSYYRILRQNVYNCRCMSCSGTGSRYIDSLHTRSRLCNVCNGVGTMYNFISLIDLLMWIVRDYEEYVECV